MNVIDNINHNKGLLSCYILLLNRCMCYYRKRTLRSGISWTVFNYIELEICWTKLNYIEKCEKLDRSKLF